MDEKRLAQVPLFASLGKKERKRIAQLADEVDLPAGREIVGQDTFAYEFFVIESGTVAVRRGDEHVAELGPGQFFGEMGALGKQRRNATVTTSSAVTAIVMSAQDFRHVTAEMPSVAQQIQAAVEERSRSIAAPA